MNIFEQASKCKLRFSTNKGSITVEDLWDLPLTSTKTTSLNSIAKCANRDLKSEGEEDFVNDISTENTEAHLKLDIAKHIISVKKAENAATNLAIVNKAKKNRILALIADKQDHELASKSEDELQALLKDL